MASGIFRTAAPKIRASSFTIHPMLPALSDHVSSKKATRCSFAALVELAVLQDHARPPVFDACVNALFSPLGWSIVKASLPYPCAGTRSPWQPRVRVQGVRQLCHALDILMCGQAYARGHPVCRSGPVMSLRVDVCHNGVENVTTLSSTALPKES